MRVPTLFFPSLISLPKWSSLYPLHPIKKTRYKFYSQAVAVTNRISLLHDHMEYPHIDDDLILRTLQTSVFKNV